MDKIFKLVVGVVRANAWFERQFESLSHRVVAKVFRFVLFS